MDAPSMEIQESFIYPKFAWPKSNTDDTNMDSSNPEETTRPRLSAMSSSTTGASSSTSVFPGVAGVHNRRLQALPAKTSQFLPGTSGLVSSGRKRKLSEKEKARKILIKKRRMMEVDVPMMNVHAAYETDSMRYGRLLGFNIVPDYQNYIIAQSAFGYGDISQSNDAKRRPSTSARHLNLIGSGDSSVSADYGRGLGYNVVSDISEYLVVQSAYGYGNISQSGASKRISHCSGKGLGCTSNKRFCY